MSDAGFLVLLVAGLGSYVTSQVVVLRWMAGLRPRVRAISRELELDWLGSGHSVLGRYSRRLMDARFLLSSLPPPMAADAEIGVLIRRLRRWALLECCVLPGFAACLLMG